uniref:RRM domain-containing protein n=1 Tax=Noctiluca scintillans TaxID=2966 RepID=A0A7S0ZSJ5_NOCSC
MGRSRSREREGGKEKEKDRRRDKEKGKDKAKDKDKEKKRSRSREHKKKEKRSRSRRRREEEQPPEEPVVERRSPSLQYRRWRFDSPPREEEYQRDAMLTGNPLGLSGVTAALQGGLALAGVSSAFSPLALAAETKGSRELYVGNLPGGITTPQLVQFLNQVCQAVKVNSLPGEPVVGATMGGGGLFAFVEFRTAEEAANGLRVNGVELLGCQLKIGRPKGFLGEQDGLQPAQNGTLGEMMAGAMRPGQLALPGVPGQAGGTVVSAIDHRLCLVNLPTFVSEERVRELLTTFGQLKFYALQKDEKGVSVGVAFFEYADMMTQQQARAALEGLELGSKRLSVKKPEEVIESGLVSRFQKLGNRVLPSRVIFLKNIVTPEDVADEGAYVDICADIRLEGEKFGPVVSMEVPRPGGYASKPVPQDPNRPLSATGTVLGSVLALEDTGVTKASPAGEVATAAEQTINPGALVPFGQTAPLIVPTPAGAATRGMERLSENPAEVPGLGYAFVEFVSVEGASKAKKGLNGRKFGENSVEAEYFSEEKYYRRDLGDPKPNTDETKRETGSEFSFLTEGGGQLQLLEEAPVMIE